MALTVKTKVAYKQAAGATTTTATETSKIALAQVICIPLSGRITAVENFDFVSAKYIQDRDISYETFTTTAPQDAQSNEANSDVRFPILKYGQTRSASEILSLLESMLTTMQAPSELHSIQIQLYEDGILKRDLVEIHKVEIEPGGSEYVKDERGALHNLLYSLNAYSFRLPRFKGKLTIRLYLVYTPGTQIKSNPEGFESCPLPCMPRVNILAKNGYYVHAQRFPALQLHQRRMTVVVEHLKPVNSSQATTTQGSLRDAQNAAVLKMISQGLDTPSGGEPTQERPTQDWGGMMTLEESRKMPVRCPCGSATEEPAMMRCTICCTRQHAACYGHLHFDSEGMLKEHACWLCLFPETHHDRVKRRELRDMAQLRRAMNIMWKYGFLDAQTIANHLACSLNSAQKIISCLDSWQWLEKTSRGEQGTLYSMVKKGQQYEQILKWFVGPPDSRL